MLRKIHPGLKALAIVAGPAALISSVHHLSRSLFPPRPYDPATVTLMQETYDRCSGTPRLYRTVQCDEYVNYLEECVRAERRCTLGSSHAVLVKLNFAPPPLRLPETDTIALTDAAAR